MLHERRGVLQKFCIDREFGFLLDCPDRRLPEKYRPWEDLAEESFSPIQDAFQPKLRLPRSIAVPFFEVSRRLGIPPVPSHGTVCLANWQKIEEKKPWSAENLDIVSFRFLRTRDNAWFFVNTAQKDLAPAICSVADVVAKAFFSEPISGSEFAFCFNEITEGLEKAAQTLQQMKKHLRPEVFYHGFRPFLNGYTGGIFEDQGGLIFEGLEHLGPMPIGGASAAQSSTMQSFDAFLKIVHDGKKEPEKRNGIHVEAWIRAF
uniref:PFL domain-containing protein n=1 Tax=Steinernema glaseri TaxID=37863 RepID=A0A1I8AH69_9BILA